MFRALTALEETITALVEALLMEVEVGLQHRQLAYTTDPSQYSCLYGYMMTWSVSRYLYDLPYWMS